MKKFKDKINKKKNNKKNSLIYNELLFVLGKAFSSIDGYKDFVNTRFDYLKCTLDSDLDAFTRIKYAYELAILERIARGF